MWSWSAPTPPTAAQAAALAAEHTQSIMRAAAAIAHADVLVLLTGAGWSADSGLAVYKDVANVAAYREREVGYAELCDPNLLDTVSRPYLLYSTHGPNETRDLFLSRPAPPVDTGPDVVLRILGPLLQ